MKNNSFKEDESEKRISLHAEESARNAGEEIPVEEGEEAEGIFFFWRA
jgi:hypothetical protein